MIRNGEPFVPPTCPVFKNGESFTLHPDQFELFAEPDPVTGKATVAGVFSDNNLNGLSRIVFTDALTPDLDTVTAVEAFDVSLSEQDYRVGELLCERVANCRGMVDGECWALGQTALREVIKQVSHELTDDSGES